LGIFQLFETFPPVGLLGAELSGIFPVFPEALLLVVPFIFPEFPELFPLVPFFTGLVGVFTTPVFFPGNIHDPSLICVLPAILEPTGVEVVEFETIDVAPLFPVEVVEFPVFPEPTEFTFGVPIHESSVTGL
jgi:hypothetical protein